MKITNINQKLCTKCHLCINECPLKLFVIEDERLYHHDPLNNCIKCGHCVAVCPTNAVNYEFTQKADSVFYKEDNFEKRALSPYNLDYFYMALKHSVDRIKNDFPELGELINRKLSRQKDKPYTAGDIEIILNIMRTMIEISIREKKLHANNLAVRIHDYILMNYHDPEIGLTKITPQN